MGAQAYGAMSIAGSTMGAIGAWQEGKQQQQAYEYNANLAMEQAEATRRAEVLHQKQMEKKKVATVGMQKAQYAGSGVAVNTGSPLDVMVDTIANYNLDMSISKYNAEVSARGFEAQAGMMQYYGKMANKEGQTRAISGLVGVAGQAVQLLG